LWNNKINNGIVEDDFLILDPLFMPGPNGSYYLNEKSEVVDAGSNTASYFGLNYKTTNINEELDKGIVDIGYHYKSNYKPAIVSRLIEIVWGYLFD
jgi:hypothetical protein